MRKNNAKTLLKECIVQSLMLLLQEKRIEEISVLEIVEKAGVNRSTYYRNFAAKQDVIRQYYEMRLDEYLSTVKEGIQPMQYFTGMFQSFLQHKKELLLLDRHALTYLLLEEMNSRIMQIHGQEPDALVSLYSNYHIGGVFNSFRYWLSEEMATPPEQLAERCLMFLPKDFSPKLLNSKQVP